MEQEIPNNLLNHENKAVLEFIKGPLFAITFTFMLLGLIRLVTMHVIQFRRSISRLSYRKFNMLAYVRHIFEWLIPVKHIYRHRPLLSFTSLSAPTSSTLNMVGLPFTFKNRFTVSKQYCGSAIDWITEFSATKIDILFIIFYLRQICRNLPIICRFCTL